MLILIPFPLVLTVHHRTDMHVPIERFYAFVMGTLDLTESEQSHLIQCSFCVEWLDACVTEKVSLLTNRYRELYALLAGPDAVAPDQMK
jgi:hypothetical protein